MKGEKWILQGCGHITHLSAKGRCYNLHYYLQSSDFYKEGKDKNHSNSSISAKSFWNFKAINDYHDEKE